MTPCLGKPSVAIHAVLFLTSIKLDIACAFTESFDRMGTSREPDLLSEKQRIALLCVAVLALCTAGYTLTSGSITTVSKDDGRLLVCWSIMSMV